MIYHLVTVQEWQETQKLGERIAPSLAVEGFIHCSTVEQVLGVTDRYYKDHQSLILLQVDPLKISAPLIFEGRGVDKFPHIYGSIPLIAVVAHFSLQRNSEGKFELPADLMTPLWAELKEYQGLFRTESQSLRRIAMHKVILKPGERSSVPHAESDEEEFVLVLRGEPHIWIDGYVYKSPEMVAVAFPSGTGIAHSFINNDVRDVELLVLGERTKEINRWAFVVNPELKEKHQDKWWEDIPHRDLGPNSGLAGDLRGEKLWAERPAFVQSIFELGKQSPPFSYPGDAETFSEGRDIARSLGLKKLGIWFERLRPGQRSGWPHCHKMEEEIAYVAAGSPSVWLQGFEYKMNPGESVAFPAGSGISHILMKGGSEDAYFVAIGEQQTAAGEQIFYPLHPNRNEQCRGQGKLWENRPTRAVGPHPGLVEVKAAEKYFLQTPRLRYRDLTDEDLENLYALDSDPEVMKYINGGKPMIREQVQKALERIQFFQVRRKPFGLWAVEEKSSSEFVGWVCLKELSGTKEQEVGYRLLRKFWGKGYATEAAKAVVDFGFNEIGLKKIVANAHPDNEASRHVLEKLGLKQTGTMKYWSASTGSLVVDHFVCERP